MNLTKPRKLLNPKLSTKSKGVTTQMEALDEYFLMHGGVHIVAEQSSCFCTRVQKKKEKERKNIAMKVFIIHVRLFLLQCNCLEFSNSGAGANFETTVQLRDCIRIYILNLAQICSCAISFNKQLL